MLWLWTLRDVAWIGTGLLLSVLALTQTGIALPLGLICARILTDGSFRRCT